MILRRESMDHETGNRIAGEESEEVKSAPPSFTALERERQSTRSTRLAELIAKAITGQLPRDRDLRYWEQDKLNDTHIEMILDSHQGMTNNEIAEKYSYTPSRVSIIMTHPDAITLKIALTAANADMVTDLDQRFKLLAPEMLSIKTDIVRNTAAPFAVRDKIASDILDRAGYGAVQKQEKKVDHTFSVPAELASKLVDGLNESNRIGVVDYTRFVRSRKDDEIAQAANLLPSGGHHEGEGVNPSGTPHPDGLDDLGSLMVRLPRARVDDEGDEVDAA